VNIHVARSVREVSIAIKDTTSARKQQLNVTSFVAINALMAKEVKRKSN
jgi:hypothetical protein